VEVKLRNPWIDFRRFHQRRIPSFPSFRHQRRPGDRWRRSGPVHPEGKATAATVVYITKKNKKNNFISLKENERKWVPPLHIDPASESHLTQ